MPKLINIAAATTAGVEIAAAGAAVAAQSLDSTSLSRFYWHIERKQVGEGMGVGVGVDVDVAVAG